jgi:hypothetical protein
MKKIILVLFLLSICSCSKQNEEQKPEKGKDSLKTEQKKPKGFESIHQKQWEEHHKDSLKTDEQDSSKNKIE